jgi:hypothetical protein
MASGPEPGEGHVPEVAQFLDLDRVVGDHLKEVVPPAARTLVASVHAAFHRRQARVRLDVLVHECQERIQVAPVDGVVDPARKLHVLQRHRPPSIPP